MTQLGDYKSPQETPESAQPTAIEQFNREMNDAAALGHDAPHTDDASSHVPTEKGEQPKIDPAKALKPARGTPDDQRAAIFKKFTEKAPEHRQGSKAFEASTDEDNYYGAGMRDQMAKAQADAANAAEGEVKAEDVSPADTTPAAADPGAQLIPVTIDGVQKMVPLKDVIAAYQKGGTADQRLEEATRLLREAKEIRATPKGASDGSAQDQQREAAEGKEQDVREGHPKPDLKAVVHKLQVGTIEEATEALGGLVDQLVQQRTPSTPDIGLAISAHDDAKESALAVEKFAKSNADLAQDENIRMVFTRNISNEMVKDISAATGLTPEQVREKVVDDGQLYAMHQAMRVKGFPMRKADKVLESAKASTTAWLTKLGHSPQPTQQHQQQRDERRANLQPQPTLRTQPAKAAAPVQPSRSSVVTAMRQARGQAIAKP